MKKTLLTSILLVVALYSYSQQGMIPNPASLYVKFLGYKSEVLVDDAGNQKKVCYLPDNTECDEWDFFRGICGQKYSYCALKGFNTESVVDSSSGYVKISCNCVDAKNPNIKIPLLEFMMQHGDTLIREELKGNIKVRK